MDKLIYLFKIGISAILTETKIYDILTMQNDIVNKEVKSNAENLFR